MNQPLFRVDAADFVEQHLNIFLAWACALGAQRDFRVGRIVGSKPARSQSSAYFRPNDQFANLSPLVTKMMAILLAPPIDDGFRAAIDNLEI